MSNRLVILGAGESGTGSAILARNRGFEVFVSDSGLIKDSYRLILQKSDIPFEEGRHTPALILNADTVIKSPGIPSSAPVVQSLVGAGVSVISEIEFASRYTDALTIAITGSNGKTTTTSLIGHMLKEAGLSVAVSGNVGKSFALAVDRGGYDYHVIEISSFQLDETYSFRADIAVLMNITPDHLDRYGNSMQSYTDSKFRIVNNQTADDSFIYCADDQVIVSELQRREIASKMLPFSFQRREGMAAYIEDESLKIEYNQIKSTLMTMHDLALRGRHNAYNSMAAAITGKVLNIRKETIRDSLSGFQGVEHRLEPVLTVCGIHFVNDSKATNVNSTWYALECTPRGIVWIAGGVDKGNDYSELAAMIGEKVSAIVCLGIDNAKIKNFFQGLVPTIVETTSMEEAVRSAYYLAKKDETVLLSPACASFDLFSNYEERGRQFKQSVRNL